MQLIDELLPVVAGAPNLGGHNRSGESIKATKAKQKMQQTQPGSDAASAATLARRAGSYSGNVAQVPNAGALQTSMGLPQGAAWDQAPLLVRVRSLFCPFGCTLLLLAACACSQHSNDEHNGMLSNTMFTFRSGPCLVPFAGKTSYSVQYLCVSMCLRVCLMLPCVCLSLTAALRVSSCTVMFAWHHTCLVVLSEGVFMFLFVTLLFAMGLLVAADWMAHYLLGACQPTFTQIPPSALIVQVPAGLLHMHSTAPPRSSTSAHVYMFML